MKHAQSLLILAFMILLTTPAFAGGEFFSVGSDGNVGIGTPSPEEYFTIRKDQNGRTFVKADNFTDDTAADACFYAKSAGPGLIVCSNPSSYTGTTGWANRGVVDSGSGGLILSSEGAGTSIAFDVGGAGSTFEKMQLTSSGNLGIGSTAPGAGLDVNGSARLITAGNKFYIKEGTNACSGISTLSGGAVTVNTSCVTSNSRVILSLQNCSSCGNVYLGTVTAGTSFVINSTNASDASSVYWQIVDKL